MFNIYPERATDATNLDDFNIELSEKNIKYIIDFLIKYNITEVWGAWGNDRNLVSLKNGRNALMSALKNNNIKVFYFGTLTKDGNPRHPLQRQEKWDINIKKYLNL